MAPKADRPLSSRVRPVGLVISQDQVARPRTIFQAKPLRACDSSLRGRIELPRCGPQKNQNIFEKIEVRSSSILRMGGSVFLCKLYRELK